MASGRVRSGLRATWCIYGEQEAARRTEDTAGETDNIVRREVIEVGFSCGDQALFE